MPCGTADAYGRCGEPNHDLSCPAVADLHTAQALLESGIYDLYSATPAVAGFSSTMTELVEQNLGMPLRRHTMFETGAARQQLPAPERRQVFADPDADPEDRMVSTSRRATGRMVDQILAQNKHLQPRERPDRLTQIADYALRQPQGPRHPDYAPAESMSERAARTKTGGVQFVEGTEPLCGSLPGYAVL
jgi:hypothetical protein